VPPQEELAQSIWPNQYADFYVYNKHDILIKEVKPEQEQK